MDVAVGHYVAFVDDDDSVMPLYFQKFMDAVYGGNDYPDVIAIRFLLQDAG